MSDLHVGRGTHRGALSVYPVWSETAHPDAYRVDAAALQVAERAGATVASLSVVNREPVPTLLLEGQLLEGGRQHRVVARSVLVPAGASLPVDVLCVEQGRWAGQGGHAVRGRRASVRVRSALHGADERDRQQDVWERVARYDASRGASETSSFVDHLDRDEARVAALTDGLRPFPGQVGVVVGVAGQPVLAEVFASPRALAAHYGSIVRSAAFDAVGLASVPTPARRVHRFLDRADQVPAGGFAPAGAGVTLRGRTEYVELSGLYWNDHLVHRVLVNPRHELALAA